MNPLLRKLLRPYARLPYTLGRGWALPVMHINFTATLRCNLNCRMCLQRDAWRRQVQADPNAARAEMTIDEIRAVLVQVPPRIAKVGFCGGEIFLRRDIMDILAMAARRNPVGLITNGILLTPEIARDLVRIRVRSVLVSLDGDRAHHDAIRNMAGAFDRTMAGLEALVKARRDAGAAFPVINVNSVLSGDNVSSLPGLMRSLHAIGLADLELQMLDLCAARFQPVDDRAALFKPPARIDPPLSGLLSEIEGLARLAGDLGMELRLKPPSTPAEFAAYYENRMDTRAYFCTFPWKTAIFSPFGDVYPCYMLSMGNLRQQSLAAIWNGAPYREFRRTLKASRLLPQCRGCCFMQRA